MAPSLVKELEHHPGSSFGVPVLLTKRKLILREPSSFDTFIDEAEMTSLRYHWTVHMKFIIGSLFSV